MSVTLTSQAYADTEWGQVSLDTVAGVATVVEGFAYGAALSGPIASLGAVTVNFAVAHQTATWTATGLGDAGAFILRDPGSGLYYEFANAPLQIGDTASVSAAGLAAYAPLPCYVAGTRIATPEGERPVEMLRPGDRVLVLRGGAWVAEPVRWVGGLTIDLARHPDPAAAMPVRIARGAFAEGVPHRDLLVSADHAILVDGALIPAHLLLNGASVTRDRGLRQVCYVHVELERHGVLRAEGLTAESYLDTGNRAQFDGEAGVRPLFPAFPGTAPSAAVWQAQGCAPLQLTGAPVAAVRARLLARAGALGHRRTHDPALAVLANGAPVPLARLASLHWRAMLPPGATEVELRSRGFSPEELFASSDRRRLGIAVTGILRDGMPLGPSAYGAGFHAPERGWRWTDGAGHLALAPLRHRSPLDIRAVPTGHSYWAGGEAHRPAADSAAGVRPAGGGRGG